jgi:glycosyltransferase involved in cell wall biosynthesis
VAVGDSFDPRVSIIVPVYNGETYLRESLDSILAQTYPGIEVIVLDDASADRTGEIAAEYGSKIQLHHQPVNKGIYANANDGIALARGEYIGVFHADDVYLPTIVEKQVEFLDGNPDIAAVFAQDLFIGQDGHDYGRLELPTELQTERPLDFRTIINALLTHRNHFLRCPGAMVRASAYRELGGYRQEQFRNTSDLEMWLRLVSKYPVAILAGHLFRYRHTKDASSTRYHRLRTDAERYFRIMDLYLDQGGREVATTEALAAHEGHRAEDQLRRAINHYILGQSAEAKMLLRELRLRALLGSRHVQRGRLFLLYAGMEVLTRLPRVDWVANSFYDHWY